MVVMTCSVVVGCEKCQNTLCHAMSLDLTFPFLSLALDLSIVCLWPWIGPCRNKKQTNSLLFRAVGSVPGERFCGGLTTNERKTNVTKCPRT